MLFIYTCVSVRMIYTFKYVRVNTPSKVFIGITPSELSGYFTPLKQSDCRARCSVHVGVLNIGLALCLSTFPTVVPRYLIPVYLSCHSSDSVYLSYLHMRQCPYDIHLQICQGKYTLEGVHRNYTFGTVRVFYTFEAVGLPCAM